HGRRDRPRLPAGDGRLRHVRRLRHRTQCPRPARHAHRRRIVGHAAQQSRRPLEAPQMTGPVDHARALASDIRAAIGEMDTLRRLPDHLATRFREAGLYRLCIPRAYDGLEATPHEIVETLEALAETDASAAWCVMISATTGAFGAYLDEDFGRRIFADPAL